MTVQTSGHECSVMKAWAHMHPPVHRHECSILSPWMFMCAPTNAHEHSIANAWTLMDAQTSGYELSGPTEWTLMKVQTVGMNTQSWSHERSWHLKQGGMNTQSQKPEYSWRLKHVGMNYIWTVRLLDMNGQPTTHECSHVWVFCILLSHERSFTSTWTSKPSQPQRMSVHACHDDRSSYQAPFSWQRFLSKRYIW